MEIIVPLASVGVIAVCDCVRFTVVGSSLFLIVECDISSELRQCRERSIASVEHFDLFLLPEAFIYLQVVPASACSRES